MHRDTYLEINLNNLKYNIEYLINKYNQYKYYIGVVKADSYGHGIKGTLNTIINSGINYLAVATLDEALEIRTLNKEIPILCLGYINHDYVDECIKNNITITIPNMEYLLKLLEIDHHNLKVHIKINTGMNRLGFKDKNEFINAFQLIKESNLFIEGIYSHIYNYANEEETNKQFKVFEEFIKSIDYETIPIIHIAASDTIIKYPKFGYISGCRLGIAMYGLSDNNEGLKSTFTLVSKVIQINIANYENIGYSNGYISKENEKIAVVPIGYADGIIRKNKNRYVYIKDKEYKIVGNICMDMLFVNIDENVSVGDKVYIIKDNEHIKEISKHLKTINYEILTSISKRIPRIYIK